MVGFSGNNKKRKARVCSPHMHHPVLVIVSIRLLPHSNHPFMVPMAQMGLSSMSGHHETMCSLGSLRSAAQSGHQETLQPQQNTRGTLLRHPLRSGMVLSGSGNLACMHKKPGQNASPAEHRSIRKFPGKAEDSSDETMNQNLFWRKTHMEG